MNLIKASLVGILGGAAVYVSMLFILKSGVSPINTPPETAFFQRLGIVSGPGPLTIGMLLFYGALCSAIYVYWLGPTKNMNVKTGLVMGITLWFFMMVFYGPIIGWGFFGFSAVNSTLPADDPLYLSSAPGYMALTLLLHLVFGTILGWLNPLFISRDGQLERLTLRHQEGEDEPRLAA